MPEQQLPYPHAPTLPFFVPIRSAPTVADVVFRSLGVAVGVFGLCIFAQWLVYDKLLQQDGIRYTTPTIAGIVTGVAAFRMLMMDRRQILGLIERFQAIAEAHHHIRNALQSLSYQRYLTEDQAAAERLLEAVNRIQWVLDEVFPRIETGKFGRIENNRGNH